MPIFFSGNVVLILLYFDYCSHSFFDYCRHSQRFELSRLDHPFPSFSLG